MKSAPDKLITISDPESPTAEAYRTLRTNILFSSLDSPLRTLLVASPGPDEGKSIILCNLAVTMAQAGSRVVVVDCDLRRPSIHNLFNLANDKGLATALIADADTDLPLQPTPIPNLRVLTAGPVPPNPSDLLGTHRLQRVIQAISALADLALFDAPPVGYLADAAILGAKLDGAVLVVSAGKTRREVALRAKTLLEKANIRLLGVVLDNAQLDADLYKVLGGRPSRSWFPLFKKQN